MKWALGGQFPINKQELGVGSIQTRAFLEYFGNTLSHQYHPLRPHHHHTRSGIEEEGAKEDWEK